jgi:X-Pro dipeptidyl-peptidase
MRIWRETAAIAVAAMFMGAAPAAAQQGVAPSCAPEGESAVTDRGPHEILPPEVVEVPSSLDGRAIQIGIVRPKLPDGQRAPVIMHASPYFAADLKEVDLRECAPFLVQNFVPHGYAVALVPTRGTGDSDGCPNLFGKVERSDLNDALTYLGTRPWSAGKVGMYGLSYDGSTPWVAAATGNPYLKTILPSSGVNDIWDLAFGKGTLDWRFWFFVSGYYHYYGPGFNNPVISGRDVARTVNTATTCPDVVQGEAASVESAQTGVEDSYGYWAERRLRPLVERNYRGSVLLTQGLQDWNVRPAHAIPWAVSLRGKGIRVHQLLGQWAHAYADNAFTGRTRWDFADRMLSWLDRSLKGDTTASFGAPVEVEDSSGRWRRLESWPPRNRQTLHLTADRALSRRPTSDTASALLAQDSRSRHYLIGSTFPAETTDADDPTPRQVDDVCVTCVAFEMTVRNELRISGLPEVFVDVTPTAPSGHVAAVLYRRAQDGLHRLGWGITDLRFPRGENTDDDTPEGVAPGTSKRLRIELEPLDAVVPAGEDLVLVLGQGNGMQLGGRPAGPVRLAYGGGTSVMRVRTVKPKRRQFFVPPSAEGRQLG